MAKVAGWQGHKEIGLVLLMIEFTKGNLLEANVDALVNTVNKRPGPIS